MRLENGVTVEVAYPPNVTVKSVSVMLPGPRGEKGDQGEVGPRGHFQHIGNGPPGLILGAQPGDTYLDQDSGTIYTLV